MKATQVLKDEHRTIERVLSALQRGADSLEQEPGIRPAFFINAALFIKNFADGCHHRKEEGVLFIAMNESGIPSQGGPIAVMLAEHEQGRLFTREMKDAAEKMDKGDMSARAAIVHNARGYVALLQQHIQKEDNILFPMAEKLIKPALQEQVDRDFDSLVREDTRLGIYDKYLALVEVLEKESLGGK